MSKICVEREVAFACLYTSALDAELEREGVLTRQRHCHEAVSQSRVLQPTAYSPQPAAHGSAHPWPAARCPQPAA